MCHCVCVCVLFKTNLDVELKLLHITCLCMSSFSICQKTKKKKPKKKLPHLTTWKSGTNQKQCVTHFTFRKKVVKNNPSTSKRNSIQLFSTSQSKTWKKPLQSVHMAWLFRAQKNWKRNVFFLFFF